MKEPGEIVELMLQKDAYSNWMGISILSIEKGYCKLSSTIKKEMLNGFEITHGGISYSLADSALAFASNSYGKQAVSIETSISHLKPTKLGDVLTIECKEIHRGKNIGRYEVSISNQLNHCIAKFYGTVFITENSW